MNQWMNIAMYGIIMASIAVSTIWILKEIWKISYSISGRWISIVINKTNKKMDIYIDGAFVYDVMVYPFALTARQVKKLYSSSKP